MFTDFNNYFEDFKVQYLITNFLQQVNIIKVNWKFSLCNTFKGSSNYVWDRTQKPRQNATNRGQIIILYLRVSIEHKFDIFLLNIARLLWERLKLSPEIVPCTCLHSRSNPHKTWLGFHVYFVVLNCNNWTAHAYMPHITFIGFLFS